MKNNACPLLEVKNAENNSLALKNANLMHTQVKLFLAHPMFTNFAMLYWDLTARDAVGQIQTESRQTNPCLMLATGQQIPRRIIPSLNGGCTRILFSGCELVNTKTLNGTNAL